MPLDEATRVRLGAGAAATPDELHALASDKSVTVRAALALNAATPGDTNAMLARDGDERVRALLARKLAVLAPTLSAGARTRLQQQTFDTLAALVDDEAVRVRATIAEVVKDLPNVPSDFIIRLARDAAPSVCDPVIRFSPLLTVDDLIALVADAPSAITRLAVARRAAIGTAVTDALAAGGTEDVLLALLMNSSAQIREATLDALVERSVDHPLWHEPLVRRPVLSPASLKTLSRIVADHLVADLAARGDLDAGAAAELRARVAGRMRKSPDPAAPDPPATKPTEDDLLQAARDGDAPKAAVILSLASGMPLPAVRRAATLRSGKALLSLAWKAGFSMKAGYAVQILLARLSPNVAIKPGPDGSFPLSVQEMSWQIDFLSGAES